MAFCKHCGTEYPDGGSCPNPACPGAQQQPASQSGNPLDGGFNEALDTVKKNKTAIIGVIAAIVVLVIVLVFVAGHTGAKGAANTFANNMYKKNGFKKATKVTMLNDAYKEFKKDDSFDDAKDAHKDMIETLKDNKVKVKIVSVKKGKKLKNKELKALKSEFKDQAEVWDVDDDIEIKKGYEYKIKIKIKHDGDSVTTTMKVNVVKVKGNGWKVVGSSNMFSGFGLDMDDIDIDDFDF